MSTPKSRFKLIDGAPLNLQGHQLQAFDGCACARLLQDNYPHENFDHDLVINLFPAWIREGVLKGWVVEDSRKLLCFGASLFITDLFAKHLVFAAAPCVGSGVLTAALSAESPLRGTSIPRNKTVQNSLNILIIHSGFPPIGSDVETACRVKALMMQAFLSLYNGYRVQQIFVEGFGDDECALYAQSGFVSVADFHLQHEQILPSPLARQTSSSLFVLTRERALGLDIHPLLPLFTYVAPKCGFSSGEQCMLARALEGHTDEELAELLNVSLSAIKKRWINIFERAEQVLPEVSINGHGIDRRRGAQRRHMLLRYVREHPEEVRSL